MADVPHYSQVRDSVQEHGLFLPVYLWQGEVLDGRLRHQAALETCTDVRFQTLEYEGQAAQVLFSLHPLRAVQKFGEGLSFSKKVKLFAARPQDVRRALKVLEPPPEKPDRRGRDVNRRLNVRMPEQTRRELRYLSKDLRAPQNEIIAAALRIADPDEIQEELMRMRRVGLVR